VLGSPTSIILANEKGEKRGRRGEKARKGERRGKMGEKGEKRGEIIELMQSPGFSLDQLMEFGQPRNTPKSPKHRETFMPTASLPRGPRYSKTFFLGIAIVCVVSGKGI
jgi:hypothetical protein